MSRSQVKGLEDKVERSNYDYSKLKAERKKGELLYKVLLIFIYGWCGRVT